MAYSRQRAVSDGTLQLLDVSLQYIRRADISVLLDGVATDQWTWAGNLDAVAFPSPIPAGVEVTLIRATQSDKVIHEFAKGAKFVNTSMDTDFRQMLYLAQEYTEGSGFTGVYSDFDMHGYRVIGLADGVAPNDAVNLRQLTDATTGIPEAISAATMAATAADAAAIRADRLREDLLLPSGSTNITFQQAGTSYSRLLQSRLRETVHLNDFPGADPTGESDSTAAFLAAAAQVGTGGNIIMDGVYSIYDEIVFTKAITLVGKDSRTGNAPNYHDSHSCIVARSPTAGAAIRIQGATVTVRDFVLVNMAGAVTGDGIRSVGENNSVKAESVVVQGFSYGIRGVEGFYNKITNSTITYCDVCVRFEYCYNVYMSGNNMRGSTTPMHLAESYCVEFVNGSSGAMFGGSFESFHGAAVRLRSGSSIGLYTVYFEGQEPNLDAYGVTLESGCSVTALNCQVYMTTMGRFITVTGSAVGVRVFARNNRFVYPTDTKDVTLYLPNPSDDTASWDVAGDNWDSNAGPNVKYASGGFSGGVGKFNIEYPAGHPKFGVSPKTGAVHMTPYVTTPPIVTTGTTNSGYEPPMALFSNSGFGGDDPVGIRAQFGYEAYWAVYAAGKWEKVGMRIPNIPNATGAASVEATLNALLSALRANGVMVS